MGYTNCSEERGWIPPFACPGIYKPFGACGFRVDHSLNIFSSPNLRDWKFEGEGLPMASRPRGIYFRPKVAFNRKTGEYVLWINLLYQAYATQASLLLPTTHPT